MLLSGPINTAESFNVTNNVTAYSLLSLPDNIGLSPGSQYELGYTNPSYPYVNYTVSGLSESETLSTQIVELGNALTIISGTMSLESAEARDNQPNPNRNDVNISSNNPPGNDLLNCLNKK
jgi:hypothetical protein